MQDFAASRVATIKLPHGWNFFSDMLCFLYTFLILLHYSKKERTDVLFSPWNVMN